MKNLLSYLVVCVMVLGGTACDGPRKACRRAEGLIARAVQKCPELMQPQVRVDTVTVLVPGATDAGSTGYTQADMDSVMTICNTLLNKALAQGAAVARKQDDAAQLVDRMRVQLCDLEPVELRDSLISLKIWTQGGELHYWYAVQPRVATTTVRTVTPTVAAKACPPEGVANWYRTWFWILATGLFLGLAVVVLIVVRSLRHVQHIGVGLTLMLLPALGMAQPVVRPDGRIWHDLPPPANLVNAGFLMEHAATTERDGTYVTLAGLLLGSVLATQNERVGLTVATLGVGYGIRLNLRSAKSERRAAQLLQMGYRVENLYEIVPDSIDAHPAMRIIPK